MIPTPTATDSPKAYNIAVPSTAELATHHTTLLKEAEDLIVADQDTHALALDGLKRATAAEKVVDDLFEDPVNSAFKAHRFLTGLRSTVKAHPSRAKALFLQKANDYEEEARRKAEEEERKRQEEARKREEERQLADAEQAEKAGDHQQSEAILNEQVVVPTSYVAPAIAKVSGVVTQTRYSAEGVDLNALICHIAGVTKLARPEFLNQVTFNAQANSTLARAQQENFKLPGVRLVKTSTKQVRSA
jgi:hypothetical protein